MLKPRLRPSINALILGAAILLTLFWSVVLFRNLASLNEDFRGFLLPWYRHILEYGRWRSLEGSYANYNPPYLYLLSIATLFDGWLPPQVLIRLTSVPFLAACGTLFWSICRESGCSKERSWLAAWVVMVAPEVVENSLYWGQSDIIHSTFLLLFLRLKMAGRPGWAMAALGVAVSFKLQAIFVGPAILALLLMGELPIWSIGCSVAGYLAMITPAALAGRPWKELLLIYTKQFDFYTEIGANVANPYELLVHLTGDPGRKWLLTLADKGGLMIAALCTGAMVLLFVRSRRYAPLTMMAISLLVEPFVLPRMHERYFFSGDIAVLLLAMIVPRMAIPAVLLQVAAVMTYSAFLFHARSGTFFLFPVAMVSISIVLVLRAEPSFRKPWSRDCSSASRTNNPEWQ